MARTARAVEGGASTVEYGAVVVLVGAIVVAVLGAGLPKQVSDLLTTAIDCVGSPGDCEAGDAGGSGPRAAPGGESGPQSAVGDQPGDAGDPGAGGGAEPGAGGGAEPVAAPDLPPPRETDSDPQDRCIQAGSEPYCSPTSSKPQPQPATPAPWEAYTWWSRLSEAERAAVIRDKPNQIRNLHGIPSDVRDDLNREFLDSEVDRLLREEGVTLRQARSREAGSEDLRAMAALQYVMRNGKGGAGGVRYGGEEYFLLSLDTERGQVAVSHGNPDTADNVSTHVPGTGSGLHKVPSELNRADGLYQAAVAQDRDAEHASITWIGYDTPGLLEAPGSSEAENGSQGLEDFQNGLRLTGGYAQNHTVVGHSYGSTLVGHALKGDNSLPVDNVVFVGSPGVGHDSADDMNFNGEAHATISDSDYLTDWWVPEAIHGPDPTSPEFGANAFGADPETAHEEYFDDPQSSQMEYMGEVIAGQR